MKLLALESAKPLRSHLRARIEIELSTRCPVKCPLCPQVVKDDHYSGWNVGFLDVDVLFNLVRSLRGLRFIVFSGAYGDPIYHPRFIEIMHRLGQEFPNLEVFVETNGSYRPAKWWRELGTKTTGRHIISFSIDGLQDTNRGYRVHADWPSIEAGIRALREYHPGLMQWKWIIFSHNQHQVREAYRLSKSLGFDVFKLVESQRHTDETRPTATLKDLEASLEAEELKPRPYRPSESFGASMS